MTLMSWLHGKLTCPARDIVSEAIAATDEATMKARSLRQQIQPYAHETDPFAAILTAHDSAMSYQREQYDRSIGEAKE